jgi:glucosamine 6-phosphate synthetase-like amidotransferase/phosphosugar isomerase protein
MAVREVARLARVPVEVEYASEFRYRNPPIDRDTIVVGPIIGSVRVARIRLGAQ